MQKQGPDSQVKYDKLDTTKHMLGRKLMVVQSAHIQVSPPPLVEQVLHLSFSDHDGVLEVME